MGSDAGVPFLSLCQESLSAAGGRVELERGDNKAKSQGAELGQSCSRNMEAVQEMGPRKRWLRLNKVIWVGPNAIFLESL